MDANVCGLLFWRFKPMLCRDRLLLAPNKLKHAASHLSGKCDHAKLSIPLQGLQCTPSIRISFDPAATSVQACTCRCPPGHGDIYPSLLGSGFLDSLIQDGIKFLFVSNSDNLGATLDLDLLTYFASTNKAFLMEVFLRARMHTLTSTHACTCAHYGLSKGGGRSWHEALMPCMPETLHAQVWQASLLTIAMAAMTIVGSSILHH